MNGVLLPILVRLTGWLASDSRLLNTTPTDYSGMRQLRLIKLDGDRWNMFGRPLKRGFRMINP
jgi:hypothetical protein